MMTVSRAPRGAKNPAAVHPAFVAPLPQGHEATSTRLSRISTRRRAPSAPTPQRAAEGRLAIATALAGSIPLAALAASGRRLIVVAFDADDAAASADFPGCAAIVDRLQGAAVLVVRAGSGEAYYLVDRAGAVETIRDAGPSLRLVEGASRG